MLSQPAWLPADNATFSNFAAPVRPAFKAGLGSCVTKGSTPSSPATAESASSVGLICLTGSVYQGINANPNIMQSLRAQPTLVVAQVFG